MASAREALSNLFGPGASAFSAPGLGVPRVTIGDFYRSHGQDTPSYLKGFENFTFDELSKAKAAQQQAADLSGLAQQAALAAKDYAAYNNANFMQYTPYEDFLQQHSTPDVLNYVMGRFNPQPQPAAVPATAPAQGGGGSYFSSLGGAPATPAPTEPGFQERLRQNMQGAIAQQPGITTDASLQLLRGFYEYLRNLFDHQGG